MSPRQFFFVRRRSEDQGWTDVVSEGYGDVAELREQLIHEGSVNDHLKLSNGRGKEKGNDDKT
jgi:hypothetical protein